VFSSGYAANLGVVTALSGPGALVVSDAANHASIVDACRLSRRRVAVVPHNDPAAVDAVLAARDEERALVVVESVDSVDGDTAPLRRCMPSAGRGARCWSWTRRTGWVCAGPAGAGCWPRWGWRARTTSWPP
jgi:8-amino-7-oxononanoate synthase